MTQANETAFPNNVTSPDYSTGLSKREYFAALALQGLLANPADMVFQIDNDPYMSNADLAIRYADALIQRLSISQ